MPQGSLENGYRCRQPGDKILTLRGPVRDAGFAGQQQPLDW